MRSACLLFLMSVLAGIAPGLQSRPSETPGGAPMIRYSGIDGVEFEYPETWARVQVHLMREPDSPIPVPPGATPPPIGLVRSDERGGRAAAFGYVAFDLDALPAHLQHARDFALSSVAVFREEDPQSVTQDVAARRIREQEGYTFSVRRPRPGGEEALLHCWITTWNGRHLFFSTALIGEDARAVAQAAEEAEAILGTVRLRDAPREPDGRLARYADGTGMIAFDYPSHWLDLPTPESMLGAWVALDADRRQTAIVRVFAQRGPGADEPPEVLDRLASLIDPAMGAQQVLSEEPCAGGGGFAGLRRVIRATRENGEAVDAHLVVLKKEETYFLLMGMVPEVQSPGFGRDLEALVSSLSTR